MLAAGQTPRQLQTGNPQEARRAFESAAFGLSRHDDAFNEDARVQLHNIKLQEAIIGLNVRQSTAAGEPDAIAGKLRAGRTGQDAQYTQQDAKQILDSNTGDENAAFTPARGAPHSAAGRRSEQPHSHSREYSRTRTAAHFQPRSGRGHLGRPAGGFESHRFDVGFPWFTKVLIVLGTALILALFGGGMQLLRRKSASGTAV